MSACRSRRSRPAGSSLPSASRMRISVLAVAAADAAGVLAATRRRGSRTARCPRSCRTTGSTCSAPTRSIQRCTSDGEMTAAPCRNHTMLERSRSSMPGRSAMRWSMSGRRGEGGDAVRLDEVDDPRGVELLEHHEVVAGEQAEQRGEAVGVVHRRHHQHDLRTRDRAPRRGERHAGHVVEHRPACPSGSPWARRSSRCCRCRWSAARPTDGSGVASSSAVASSHGEVVDADATRRRSPRARARAPSRGGPTAPAPAPRRASTPPARVMTNSGELRRPTATRVPRPTPRACSARAIWVERRCSSGQVTTVSVPSIATTRTTGDVGSDSASCATRSP